jgi:hypothetical protein
MLRTKEKIPISQEAKSKTALKLLNGWKVISRNAQDFVGKRKKAGAPVDGHIMK